MVAIANEFTVLIRASGPPICRIIMNRTSPRPEILFRFPTAEFRSNTLRGGNVIRFTEVVRQMESHALTQGGLSCFVNRRNPG